jgi:hypothetical protein
MRSRRKSASTQDIDLRDFTMLYHTSRSALQPFLSAGRQARSRAFFDLIAWVGHTATTAWSRFAPKLKIKSDPENRVLNHPSGAMHA